MLSFSIVFVCLQQQTETKIQMIKMVNEFKLTVVHFARPNTMQICACAWIYRWTEKPWKMRSGLPGLRAAGPPGRRAAGPSRAVGRGPLGLRAAGPLGHGGPWAANRWAAGLLLAKPSRGNLFVDKINLEFSNVDFIIKVQWFLIVNVSAYFLFLLFLFFMKYFCIIYSYYYFLRTHIDISCITEMVTLYNYYK